MDSDQAGAPNGPNPGAPHPGAQAHPGGSHPLNKMPATPGWGRRIFWFLFVLVIAALLLGGPAYFEYVTKPAMMAHSCKAPPPPPVETAVAETEDMPRALE